MIKKFSWKKWDDPIKNMQQAAKSKFKKPYDDDDDDDDEDDVIPSSGVFMTTHLGSLPLAMTDTQFVSDHIDFWIMSTTFDITNGIVNIVGAIRGIESVEPLTRYSMRIGFPKSGLFNVDDVQCEIQRVLIEYFHYEQDQEIKDLEPALLTKVKEFRNTIDNKYQCWVIYMLPNGSIELVTSERRDDEFIDKANFLVNTFNTIGGKLLHSEGGSDG